jgi:hypothetical protein
MPSYQNHGDRLMVCDDDGNCRDAEPESLADITGRGRELGRVEAENAGWRAPEGGEYFDIESGVPLSQSQYDADPLSGMPISRYDDIRKAAQSETRHVERIPGDKRGGCLIAALLLVLLAVAWFLGVGAAIEDAIGADELTMQDAAVYASPIAADLALQERRIEALATRVTELETRVQRTADAAAGFDPLPTRDVPDWIYDGPNVRNAVTPPDGIPTVAPTVSSWQGTGGMPR